jgi:hypothetical protein
MSTENGFSICSNSYHFLVKFSLVKLIVDLICLCTGSSVLLSKLFFKNKSMGNYVFRFQTLHLLVHKGHSCLESKI